MARPNFKISKLTISLGALAAISGATFGSPFPADAAPQTSPNPGHPAPAYAASYNAIMRQYRAKMVALTSRPLPSKLLPKDQWRNKMAGQLDDLANAVQSFARKMDALKPPANLRETHAATRAFFQVSADGNRRVAAAIRTGEKDAVDDALAQTEQAESQALVHIFDAVQKAGGDAQPLSAAIQTLTAGAPGR